MEYKYADEWEEWYGLVVSVPLSLIYEVIRRNIVPETGAKFMMKELLKRGEIVVKEKEEL